MTRLSQLDLRQFVKTWQNSESPRGCADRLNIKTSQATSIAKQLISHGVNMRKFPQRRRYYPELIAELKTLAMTELKKSMNGNKA